MTRILTDTDTYELKCMELKQEIESLKEQIAAQMGDLQSYMKTTMQRVLQILEAAKYTLSDGHYGLLYDEAEEICARMDEEILALDAHITELLNYGKLPEIVASMQARREAAERVKRNMQRVNEEAHRIDAEAALFCKSLKEVR